MDGNVTNKKIVGTVSGSYSLVGGVGNVYGRDGKSAYEIALLNGFEGTEAEWLESLHGKDGVDGAAGKDGIDGYTPVKGKDYFDGEKGDTGNPGIYLGSGEMPDDCNVQIDPNGDTDTIEDIARMAADMIGGGSGTEERWELLTEVTLTEDVAVIELTAEGMADCKKLFLETGDIVVTQNSSIWVLSNNMNSDWYTLANIFVAPTAKTAYRLFIEEMPNGDIYAHGSEGSGTVSGSHPGNQSATISYTDSQNAQFPVSKIRVRATGSASIVAGPSFKVWGVK